MAIDRVEEADPGLFQHVPAVVLVVARQCETVGDPRVGADADEQAMAAGVVNAVLIVRAGAVHPQAELLLRPEAPPNIE